MLPLTKILDPADYKELAAPLQIVDLFAEELKSQHPARRWEYALALQAIGVWEAQRKRGLLNTMALDAGGAGSPFYRMLAHCGYSAHVIDPKEGELSLEQAVAQGISAPIVTCISVIEHVEGLLRFIDSLVQVTEPGGLLFLTSDIREEPPAGASWIDDRHFHWMRKRIWTPSGWSKLADAFVSKGFRLSEADFTYHGHQVFDYSFAAMTLWRPL